MSLYNINLPHGSQTTFTDIFNAARSQAAYNLDPLTSQSSDSFDDEDMAPLSPSCFLKQKNLADASLCDINRRTSTTMCFFFDPMSPTNHYEPL